MKHADLIDRLNAGSGPDRGIDGRIALWRGWGCHYSWGDDPASAPHFDEWPDIGGHWCPPDAVDHSNPHKCECWSDKDFAEPPRWTESLDACIGLMREVLPGLRRTVGPTGLIEIVECVDAHDRFGWAVRSRSAHKEETYAILIAILQAVGEAG